MKYTRTSKATRYKGIVFRSLLEARCYDYLLSKYPQSHGYTIQYEPQIERISHLWNPDFGIYQDSELESLVEVKPQTLFFDTTKYIVGCASSMNESPCIICMTGSYMVFFNEDGGFNIEVLDPLVWAQTFNNVRNG